MKQRTLRRLSLLALLMSAVTGRCVGQLVSDPIQFQDAGPDRPPELFDGMPLRSVDRYLGVLPAPDHEPVQTGAPVILVQATTVAPDEPTQSDLGLSISSLGFTGLTRSVFAEGLQLFETAFRYGYSQLAMGINVDAGSMLSEQPGVVVHLRAAPVSATKVRGRRLGGIQGNGSYWFPARQDLDTLLSKIDSRLVREIITVKGPYSAVYGPSLSFFDVVLFDAPRYENGFEAHTRSVMEYQTNGDQWHLRQSVWGGSSDWGFRIGYGHRKGSDYETGAGFSLPTSFESGIPDMSLGADITDDHHVDFQYFRLDQSDVEFPGQFYDISDLVTESYELRYVWDTPRLFDRMAFEVWKNKTQFNGDNDRDDAGRRINATFMGLPGRLRSTVNVSAESSGYRLAFVRGEADQAQFTIGTDLRHLEQQLTEINRVDVPLLPFDGILSDTIIPPAHSTNPGIFVESSIELTECLRIKSGSRVDWLRSNAESSIDLTGDGDPEDLIRDPIFGLGGLFDREFSMWMVYSTFEFDVNSNWQITGGFGRAMRAPTMTELYSLDPTVAILPQLIITKLRGNPNLSQERMWQVDFGLGAEFEFVRTGINGFYSWIEDYITFENIGEDPNRNVVYSFVNTDWATLSGGEAFLECDVTSTLTAFASLSFVEGRDHTRNRNAAPTSPNASNMRTGSSLRQEPLPVIAPMDGRVGFRVQPEDERPRWSIEMSARIVDGQDRVATLLREETTAGFTVYDVAAYWQVFDDVLMTAGITNLTDKFYRDHFDTRNFAETFQRGQNFYVGLEVTR